MSDIYVHLRMKECCRSTLKDLDRRKKKAKFRAGILVTPSLHDELGNKPIDEACKALHGSGTESADASEEGEFERIARITYEQICKKHAKRHDRANEVTEGRFWREMALAIHK